MEVNFPQKYESGVTSGDSAPTRLVRLFVLTLNISLTSNTAKTGKRSLPSVTFNPSPCYVDENIINQCCSVLCYPAGFYNQRMEAQTKHDMNEFCVFAASLDFSRSVLKSPQTSIT